MSTPVPQPQLLVSVYSLLKWFWGISVVSPSLSKGAYLL
uniref:Uncharacterized protein n=1 Tax=Arundo donax TaxID=35708 RepID=A0A0A9AZL6_ARUDO